MEGTFSEGERGVQGEKRRVQGGKGGKRCREAGGMRKRGIWREDAGGYREEEEKENARRF